MSRKKRIEAAFWSSFDAGVVRLCADWTQSDPPPLRWAATRLPIERLVPVPPIRFAEESGYFGHGEMITFLMSARRYPQYDWESSGLFVAGEFNGWGEAVSKRAWELEPTVVEGKEYFLLSVARRMVCPRNKPEPMFKFVTGRSEWLEVPAGAPNAVHDQNGIRNFVIRRRQSGRHQFAFRSPSLLTESSNAAILWVDGQDEEVAPLLPGDFIRALGTDLPMGALIENDTTVFRLFAPRASEVSVTYFQSLSADAERTVVQMKRLDDSIWEGRAAANLDGWYYHYSIASRCVDSHSAFDPGHPVLDPFALATVGPTGPGIILDRDRLPVPDNAFVPPNWQDLVIAESHVRDLTVCAPIAMSDLERLGFRGLARWVRDPHFHLHDLGVNAVELLPVQQFDAENPADYHWGYMTNNWFAPSAWYASNPGDDSAYKEFQDLVAAFHERGMAVILDVVYNHVGVPNHLQFIDKHYFFELGQNGEYINWSGCGNTMHFGTPMADRLITESLVWLVQRFDVDGFRFDLAELVGMETLRLVEATLKRIKPGIIMIAEPWSFRGDIAHALKQSGYAFWNDGFREFLPSYVFGHGNAAGLRYYLSGSLGHRCAWPAQSVNYTESHDDRAWIDRITENAYCDGSEPTPRDRRRTHLMCAILFMSLGVPMLAAGQDMLRSKQGNANTYLRGDLNALHYERAVAFSSTHEYFKRWISFRLSESGKPLRLYHPPTTNFIRFYGNGSDSAAVALYNADRSVPSRPLLFAVNPHPHATKIDLSDLSIEAFVQIADAERFEADGLKSALLRFEGRTLLLPPLQCGLWIES